ncbi:CYB protein, partial [Quiscalus mexicanus]|nr:CYB protein [Quiscalus mexicanus]NXV54613.1 CYB protein [Molothrus ater]NXV66443.1 CYB protein [Molothrus ater]
TFLHPTFFHVSGSNNPQGIVPNCGKIPFLPYFSVKDILVFILTFLLLLTLPAY